MSEQRYIADGVRRFCQHNESKRCECPPCQYIRREWPHLSDEHNDGYRPEDISVDESQWHGTPFTRGPELKDGDVAHDGYGCQCPQADDGRRMGTSSLCATHGEVEHSDGDVIA